MKINRRKFFFSISALAVGVSLWRFPFRLFRNQKPQDNLRTSSDIKFVPDSKAVIRKPNKT